MKNKVVSGIMVILFLTLALSISINQCQSFVEMWVPYVPFSSMVDLELWELSGIWHMDVSITFGDSGYMISDWGMVMEDGSEFWVDCEIWDWTGYAAAVITTLCNTYSLGHLEEGSYTFTFKAWGIDIKSVSFTVPPDPAPDPAPDLFVEATSVWWHECPQIGIGHVYSVYVNVTNQGTADAGSFNVSFSTYREYAPEVPESLEKKTVTSLDQGVTESMQFDFSAMNYGNYTIVVMADCDTAVAELDETNNVKTEWVLATVLGDIDGDGDSDPFDFSKFRNAYGSRGPPQVPVPDPNYDYWCDFDRDGDVDSFDFGIFRVNYGANMHASVFSQNFDEEPTGSAPQGWIVENPDICSLTVNETIRYGDSGKSARYVDSASCKPNGSSYVGRTFEVPFTGQNSILIAEFSMMAEVPSYFNLYIDDGIMKYHGVNIYFTPYGRLAYYDDSGWHYLRPFSIDTWVRIKMVIDISKNTYDIYVDGVLEAEGAHFRGFGTVTQLSRMLFGGNSFEMPIGYIDEISLCARKS